MKTKGKTHSVLGLATAAGLLLAACGGGSAAPVSSAAAPAAPASIAAGSAAPASSAAAVSTAASPAAASSAAASAATGAKVSITLWHTQSEQTAGPLNDLITKFNATHPNITVKGEFVGNYDQEYQKLISAAKAGGLPEMAVAYENVVSDLMKANIIVPLDGYVKGKDGLSKESLDDIFPGYIATNTFKQYNNQLLSFPFTKSQLMAYYNMDMLTAAGVTKIPETWDEYGAAMQKVQDYAKAKGIPFNGAEALNVGTSNVDDEILSRGGTLTNADQTKVTFNSEQGVAALSFDAGLVKSGAAYIYKGFDWQNDFAAGKTASTLDSSISYAFVDPLIKKAPQPFKEVVAGPPAIAGQKYTVMYGANVAMFKSSPEKQAAAWQFIKWFTDTDQTAQWSIQTHYLPIRKSAANSDAFKKELEVNQPLKASFDYLQYAHPEPNVAGWQAVRDIILNAETAAVTGKMTPKQALDDAATKADKALQEA